MKIATQKISVIVPVYNTADYLDKCLLSLLNQTYTNIEIILVDDGSTDRSGEICDRYAKENENVIVVHTENGGSSAARNTGLKHVSGEYIGFIDSDDYITVNFYEEMMRYMSSDVDMVSCGVQIVNPDGKIMVQSTPNDILLYEGDAIIKALLETIYINFSMCNKLFRKKCLKGVWFPLGENHEDIPVMYQAAKNSSKCVCLNQANYFYTVRQGSNSRRPFNEGNVYLATATMNIYRDVKKNYPKCRRVALYRHFEYVMYLVDLINEGKTREFIGIRDDFAKEIRRYTISILKNQHINPNLKVRLLWGGGEIKAQF